MNTTERRVKELETLERWKAGENVGYLYVSSDVPVALRINGDEVETSRGASFPVTHAVRGIAFIQEHASAGWKRNGHTFHLGHYAIDEIEVGGNVKAGCHYVEYAEIARIAELLPK